MRALAIGNFDGVHRGHVTLFERAQRLAAQDGLIAAALTFEPHPADVVAARSAATSLGAAPLRPIRRLTGPARKRHLLEQLAPEVWAEAFTDEVSRESPEEFVRRLLVERLQVKHLVVGENFRFGHKRAGDLEVLRALGERYGFAVHPLGMQSDATGVLSSSRARELVQTGQAEAATHVLGHYHAVFGEVMHGDKRGRTLGVPTANLLQSAEMFPGRGIYAVLVGKGGPEGRLTRYATGVASVGTRPTIDPNATQESIEVHLFDRDEDLYGQTLGVAFVTKLRDELRFDSLDALTTQMQLDIQQAKDHLRDVSDALLR